MTTRTHEPTPGAGPLEGITVIDLTQMLSGAYATLLLAGLGARVIKVENPRGRDPARQNAPYMGADGLSLVRQRPDDVSVPFANRGRGKESITLDLKSEAGRGVLADLIARADLVVENFSAGTADRMGIGYDFAAAHNPAVVYCSISGFGGGGGPAKAMDVIIQAFSGMMMASGQPDEDPLRVGLPIADLTAPLFALIGSLSALIRARATGQGEHVDVSMLGCLTSLLACEDFDVMNAMGLPYRTGNSLPRLAPFGVYPALDGHVAICAPSDAFCVGLFAVTGQPELMTQPRFATRDQRVANSPTLDAIIADWARGRTAEDIVSALHDVGTPAARVRTPSEAIRDPHVAARREVLRLAHPEHGEVADVWGTGVPMVFSRSATGFEGSAPHLGDDTRSILEQLLGYSSDQVDTLAGDETLQRDHRPRGGGAPIPREIARATVVTAGISAGGSSRLSGITTETLATT